MLNFISIFLEAEQTQGGGEWTGIVKRNSWGVSCTGYPSKNDSEFSNGISRKQALSKAWDKSCVRCLESFKK